MPKDAPIEFAEFLQQITSMEGVRKAFADVADYHAKKDNSPGIVASDELLREIHGHILKVVFKVLDPKVSMYAEVLADARLQMRDRLTGTLANRLTPEQEARDGQALIDRIYEDVYLPLEEEALAQQKAARIGGARRRSIQPGVI